MGFGFDEKAESVFASPYDCAGLEFRGYPSPEPFAEKTALSDFEVRK